MNLALFVIFWVLSAGTLFHIVKAMNPNPEHNPAFTDCLAYCFIGSLAGRLPFGLFLWLGFWGWVFSNKFYLNTGAMIISLIVMFVVNVGAAIFIAGLLTPAIR